MEPLYVQFEDCFKNFKVFINEPSANGKIQVLNNSKHQVSNDIIDLVNDKEENQLRIVNHQNDNLLKLSQNITEMVSYVDKKLKNCRKNDVVVEGFGLRIKKNDLETLKGLNWVNDEVINFYMNLLIDRSQDPNYPDTHTINTFFYPKLLKEGYDSIKRWTQKTDIFKKNYFMIPINNGIHWSLAVINFDKKVLEYYDSLEYPGEECLKTLQKFLKAEYLDKKKSYLDLSRWKNTIIKNIPLQENGSDCGVFMLVYAEYISANKVFDFNQQNMKSFRTKITYEILKKKIL